MRSSLHRSIKDIRSLGFNINQIYDIEPLKEVGLNH